MERLVTSRNHVAVISVDGMTCNSCVDLITHAVSHVPGVSGVNVNLRGGEAVVQFQPQTLKSDYIASIISDMGYTAVVEREMKYSCASMRPQLSSNSLKPATVHVEGMVCINCAQIIETGLRKMEGIEQISVSVEEKQAHVLYNRDALSIQSITHQCSAGSYRDSAI
jgi:Cu+-exporting ATPase